MKYYINIIKNFLLGYYRFGKKTYPVLFPLGIPFYLLLLIFLCTTKIDEVLVLGILSYSVFYWCILIEYLNHLKHKF